METRQMISFLYPLFPLFVTFISEFENSQNSFSFGPPFDPFWSVKYINVGQKLPIRTAEHTFVESRHPEDTKNSYYTLPLQRSQKKKVSAHGLLLWYLSEQPNQLHPPLLLEILQRFFKIVILSRADMAMPTKINGINL